VQLAWDATAVDGVLFEIQRDGQRRATVSEGQWTDREVQNGTKYNYSVIAVDWQGNRAEPAGVEVAVPQVPDRGPVPPAPDVRLSSLKPLRTKIGWGQLGVNKSCTGGELLVGGKPFADGLGMHASSQVVYARQAAWRRLVAIVGVDGAKRDDPRASVVFRVISESGGEPARETVLAASPRLQNGPLDHWHFDVALPDDCRRLRLEVDDAGDDNKADHADWVEAGFLTGMELPIP
jgi:hypothetical protein